MVKTTWPRWRTRPGVAPALLIVLAGGLQQEDRGHERDAGLARQARGRSLVQESHAGQCRRVVPRRTVRCRRNRSRGLPVCGGRGKDNDWSGPSCQDEQGNREKKIRLWKATTLEQRSTASCSGLPTGLRSAASRRPADDATQMGNRGSRRLDGRRCHASVGGRCARPTRVTTARKSARDQQKKCKNARTQAALQRARQGGLLPVQELPVPAR